MNLEQVYYTSCKRGLRGGAGFQINAATPTIDRQTLAQIERCSGYQPPLALAYSRDMARERYPTALSYYRLGEQTCVVARSVYLGVTEADARGGNFFTHSLISRDGPAAFASLAPIQLWRSPIWHQSESPSL